VFLFLLKIILMDKTTFLKIIQSDTQKLKHRDILVNACLKNTSWASFLLTNMKSVDNENSNVSARILELSCKENIEIIIPYLDFFCELLNKLKLNGVIRVCSKICELLMIEYFVNKNRKIMNSLQNEHLEKIIEAGFIWMITDQKIAVQAYTMQTLFLLGTKFDWIHNELAIIIEKNIPTGSTGYKNRGRKVLRAIETSTNLKL